MRIIAGEFKSRVILKPKGIQIRPTKDKVKEALFSIIGDRVYNSMFLDLCCGSGSIGLEALSRGAEKVVFVDKQKECIDALRKNSMNLGVLDTDKVIIYKEDMFRFISNFTQFNVLFDIVFLDPPYYRDLAKKCLKKVILAPIIKNSGIIIVEHHKRDILPEESEGWKCTKSRIYGDTMLSFFENVEV